MTQQITQYQLPGSSAPHLSICMQLLPVFSYLMHDYGRNRHNDQSEDKEVQHRIPVCVFSGFSRRNWKAFFFFFLTCKLFLNSNICPHL